MKHWILEVGNTRTKWACFDAQAAPSASPVEVHSAAASEARTASTWRDAVGPEDKVMVTGSGDLDPWASAFPEAMVLRPGDPTPLPTAVTAPEGLGLDRVANAWAVLHHGFADATSHDAWLIVDVAHASPWMSCTKASTSVGAFLQESRCACVRWRKGRRVCPSRSGELRSPIPFLHRPHWAQHRGSTAARRVGRCGG